MAITKEKKAELVKEFQREAGDSGSPDVQIAILTNRIQHLTAHMQKNKKDYSTRRGLLGMVSRRRRLLDYVRKHDADRYLDLLERLNIRK
jgi:small subunit ribosomal protein S15